MASSDEEGEVEVPGDQPPNSFSVSQVTMVTRHLDGGKGLKWFPDVIQCAAVNTPMDLRGDRFPMKAIGNHYPSRMCQ